MRRILLLSLTIIVFGAFGTPAAWAQDQPQQPQQPQPQKPLDQATPPIPAIRSPLASAAGNDDEDEVPQQLAPDTRALAGVQPLTVGGPAVVHRYWEPHLAFTSTVDSNPPTAGQQNGGWTNWSSVTGGVDIRQVSGSSDFTLNYIGGGSFSNQGGLGSSIVQEFGAVDRIAFRRETLTLIDQMNYLPEAAFGYSAFGTGFGLPGIGLQPGFGPSQSILTPEGQTITNVFAAELDTPLTPRSSISMVGSYNLLHYFDNNLLNSDGFAFQAGYNYLVSRKDTLAVFYRYNGFRYGNFNQSIDGHSAQVSYGHRVTGRLAFQVGGGPQISISQTPITGSVGAPVGAGGTGSFTHVYWTLTTGLSYQLRRVSLGLGYNHGISEGSGVFAGSIADTFSGSASRQLSRTFFGSLNTGYSRNSGEVLVAKASANQVFDYVFVGGSLAHPWGRSMSLGLSYQMQYQTSSAPFCLGTACQTSYFRNLISFNLGWHKQPIPF